jgi:ATP-dependent exoDNAse (exonuclease V) beta subunit
MASGDSYPHAEERRLLYVALTKAKRHATVITEQGRESKFAVELMDQRSRPERSRRSNVPFGWRTLTRRGATTSSAIPSGRSLTAAAVFR